MFKLDKTVIVHGSFSLFSAIWSHSLSGVQAQTRRLWTAVIVCGPLSLVGLYREGRAGFLYPASARPSPETLSPAAWLPEHLCFPCSPYAPEIFLPLPLLGKAVRSRVCAQLPAFLVVATEILPS